MEDLPEQWHPKVPPETDPLGKGLLKPPAAQEEENAAS